MTLFRMLRFALAGGVGALLGWILFEPWGQDVSQTRDFLLLYGVSFGIVFLLIIEKFIVHRKFGFIRGALKNIPIYIIPLIGVIFVKLYFSSQDQRQVETSGPDAAVETRFLVLDISSSMNGSPLRELKDAVSEYLSILDEMQSRDEIGCITFNDDAKLELRPGTDYDKIRRRVQQLDSGGGTNMYDALDLANEQFSRADEALSREIILVTDGKPNTRGPEAVRDYVADLKDVKLFTIGVGSGYDRDLLEEVADETGGNFYSADNIQDLTSVFVRIARAQGLTETSSADKIALPFWKRILAWSILGLCIGLAIGVGDKRREMMLVGSAGGFLGGALSSILFTIIDLLAANAGPAARMVSFAVLGFSIGLTLFWVNALYSRLRPQTQAFRFQDVKNKR